MRFIYMSAWLFIISGSKWPSVLFALAACDNVYGDVFLTWHKIAYRICHVSKLYVLVKMFAIML